MDSIRLSPAAGAALLAAAFVLAAPLLPAGPDSVLAAQDVELLGRMHGTRPPDAYFQIRQVEPGAFEFGRAWKNRTGLGVRVGMGDGDPSSGTDVARTSGTSFEAASATGLGRRDGPVVGTFTFPLVLGLFADSESTPPYSADEIQSEYFTGPNSRYRTITEYYDEVSRDLVTVRGETFDWKRSSLTQDSVTGTSNGLGRDAEVGEFIVDVIEQLDDDGVDWSRFDNDGPDGVPNSGDDDGFVDVLAVLHPTEGAECGTGEDAKIWSHRWQLRAALDDPDAGPYETSTTGADGTPVKIDDYVIVPTLECDWRDDPDGDDDPTNDMDLNQIGVLAHELGHGFGLPDLYGTGSRFVAGAGNWGLMATGSWGCNASSFSLQTPERPCHPGAWTKYVMGWIEVDTIPAGADLQSVTLEPVEAGGRVLRVETNDGSGEYFLLENRDRRGFDETLMQEGLLVWHVDPAQVDRYWGGNRVNADRDHPGVWLRQADGLNDLMDVGGGRGDPGDPFPGLDRQDAFHAGTTPSTFTHGGGSSGLTLTGIRRDLTTVELDLENRYYTVSMETEGTSSDSTFFTVDGAAAPAATHSFSSAPFQAHVIEAATGDLVDDGVRVGFESWEDGSARVREFVTMRADTLLVATYGGRELQFHVEMTSPSDTVTPGVIDLEPGTEDLWVPEGATVRVEAVARTGFEFVEWSGAFADRSNPFMIDAVEPLSAGARFDVTYTAAVNPTRLELVAAEDHELTLNTENGTEPVRWSVVQGALPRGLELDGEGTITGAPLEDGSFGVVLRVQDAIGLQADLKLEMAVDPPPVGTLTLTAPFLMGPNGPTGLQEEYMDWMGNRSGAYDVGDFRAFLRRHPDTPASDRPASPQTRIEVPPVRLEGGSEEPDAVSGGDGPGMSGSGPGGNGGGAS